MDQNFSDVDTSTHLFAFPSLHLPKGDIQLKA